MGSLLWCAHPPSPPLFTSSPVPLAVWALQLPGDPTVFHRALFTVVHEEILSYASAHLQLLRELKPGAGGKPSGPSASATAARAPATKAGYVVSHGRA